MRTLLFSRANLVGRLALDNKAPAHGRLVLAAALEAPLNVYFADAVSQAAIDGPAETGGGRIKAVFHPAKTRDPHDDGFRIEIFQTGQVCADGRES